MDMDLAVLRRDLHRIPELSGNEQETANRILDLLMPLSPDRVITELGGHGLAVLFQPEQPDPGSPVRMLRADLDGVPVAEVVGRTHGSRHEGIGHMCGHDGHMAALVGLAGRLADNRNRLPAPVILLFQPAEEDGTGARKVLADARFVEMGINEVFGWHNLPGYPVGTVVLKEGVFASASRGMTLRLSGTSAHAAYPEDGNSPLPVLKQLLEELPLLPQQSVPFHHAARVVIVGAKLGEGAFGTMPSTASLQVTFRAHRTVDMNRISEMARQRIRHLAVSHGLEWELDWQDEFDACVNEPGCVETAQRAAEQCNLPVQLLDDPLPWSEDFGVFTANWPGVLFGLGAGTGCPGLHQGDYDFPDELLAPAVSIMEAIAFQS